MIYDSLTNLSLYNIKKRLKSLLLGSWDNNVRCWEIDNTGKSIPKAQQTMQGPILDVCWHDDGSKVD